MIISNMKKYSIASLVALVIGGCSSDSSFSGEEEIPVTTKSIELVIGEPQEVQTGDTLTPTNEDTEITVEHIIGEDIKKVTLLAGEATLVYGDYYVEESNY